MNRDELVKRWLALPEAYQNGIAGNFFPEIVTEETPAPILRAISIAIENARDVIAVDGGTLSFRDAIDRQRERELTQLGHYLRDRKDGAE